MTIRIGACILHKALQRIRPPERFWTEGQMVRVIGAVSGRAEGRAKTGRANRRG